VSVPLVLMAMVMTAAALMLFVMFMATATLVRFALFMAVIMRLGFVVVMSATATALFLLGILVGDVLFIHRIDLLFLDNAS